MCILCSPVHIHIFIWRVNALSLFSNDPLEKLATVAWVAGRKGSARLLAEVGFSLLMGSANRAVSALLCLNYFSALNGAAESVNPSPPMLQPGQQPITAQPSARFRFNSPLNRFFLYIIHGFCEIFVLLFFLAQ